MRGIRICAGLLALLSGPCAARAASPPVAAAETTLRIDAGTMHTQYHENLPAGIGDDESGYTAGFGVAAGALVPFPAAYETDLYTALGLDLSAGNIRYGGHYLFSGLPATATDNAVFNRIEARAGAGLPLPSAGELIAFVAGGYQTWNRNVNQKGQIGTDEFYRAGLAGGGLKFDQPLTPALVVSATAELLAVVGGNVRNDGQGFQGSFGPSGEEIASLGLDYAVTRRVHTFASIYYEHFNYAGSQPDLRTPFYEPLSTTTQFGANVGVGYSFN